MAEFSAPVAQALQGAFAEAQLQKSPIVGTPHLFIALTKQDGITATALRGQGQDPKRIRDGLRAALGQGQAAPGVEPKLTARAAQNLQRARGDLRVIGATTPEEYQRYIMQDAALERRFQQVWVPEPRPEEALEMLRGVKARYETHHGVVIADEALEAGVTLSVAWLPDRHLPDKALDFLTKRAPAPGSRRSASRLTEWWGLSSPRARWRRCWGSGRGYQQRRYWRRSSWRVSGRLLASETSTLSKKDGSR